jgi:hypothetical protein
MFSRVGTGYYRSIGVGEIEPVIVNEGEFRSVSSAVTSRLACRSITQYPKPNPFEFAGIQA